MRKLEYVYTSTSGEVTIYTSFVAVTERLNRSGGHYKVRLENIEEPKPAISEKRKALRPKAYARV